MTAAADKDHSVEWNARGTTKGIALCGLGSGCGWTFGVPSHPICHACETLAAQQVAGIEE